MNAQRTEQKLRYAELILSELRASDDVGANNDWENAHQESFFFHLAGAIENVLHEVNTGYGLGLALDKVRWVSVENRLGGVLSPAFVFLKQLKDDDLSWLALLDELRNNSTHRAKTTKIVYGSTRRKVDNEFNDPRTGTPQTVYMDLKCTEFMERLFQQAKSTILCCRAIDQNLQSK